MRVFPTCVGMNRNDGQDDNQNRSVPHVRGDEPGVVSMEELRGQCVPHVRGDEPACPVEPDGFAMCSPRAWG